MSSTGYRRVCEDHDCRATVEIPWKALAGISPWDHGAIIDDLAQDRGWQVVGAFRCPEHTQTGPVPKTNPVTGGTPHALTCTEGTTP